MTIGNRKSSIVNHLDWPISLAVALVGGWLMYPYIYSPMRVDDVRYMAAAWTGFVDNDILFRYGFIYMLKAFMAVTGSAMVGAKVYCMFIWWGTAAITYNTGRLLFGRGAGVLAAAWFFTQGPLEVNIGSPLADFAVMFVGMIIVYVFVKSKIGNWKSAILLVCLVVWVINCKETGLLYLIFLLPFVRVRRDILLTVAVGGLVMVYMAIINYLVIAEPVCYPELPAVVARFFTRYGGGTKMSWFIYAAHMPVLPALLLYLRGRPNHVQNSMFDVRCSMFVWSLPIVWIVFFTIAHRDFYIQPRWLTPVMPIFYIFAAGQVVRVKGIWENPFVRSLSWLIGICGGLVIAIAYLRCETELISYFGVSDTPVLFRLLVLPLGTLALLAFDGRRWYRVPVIIAVIMVVLIPMGKNFYYIAKGQAAAVSRNRMEKWDELQEKYSDFDAAKVPEVRSDQPVMDWRMWNIRWDTRVPRERFITYEQAAERDEHRTSNIQH